MGNKIVTGGRKKRDVSGQEIVTISTSSPVRRFEPEEIFIEAETHQDQGNSNNHEMDKKHILRKQIDHWLDCRSVCVDITVAKCCWFDYF